jgi:hypothetical protein
MNSKTASDSRPPTKPQNGDQKVERTDEDLYTLDEPETDASENQGPIVARKLNDPWLSRIWKRRCPPR